MSQLIAILQDIAAAAFLLLGVFTAVAWIRRRDRSLAYLAATIVLLAAVVGVGIVQALLHLNVPLAGDVELVAFLACAYTLLRYRDALIPLPRRWHAAAIFGLVAASGSLFAAEAVGATRGVLTVIAVVLIVIWCACVGEPIVRFWIVAGQLAAVQAWRLRSLSLGFGGLVLILLLAIGAGALARQPVFTVLVELLVIAIVPLLYASFAPPAWLRRQWRSAEEAGLRAFMEELLVSDDRDPLAGRGLAWAVRLVGGSSGVLFNATADSTATIRLEPNDVLELQGKLPDLQRGVNRTSLDGRDVDVLMLPVKGLAESGTLLILGGPFTPDFGPEEVDRLQQFMTAFVTALDRHHLVVKLEESNHALRDANRHKSVFLANMSHELRTPLNAIIGFSELLQDAKDGQFDEATRRRFNNQILTSGRHLLTLINDILDLSKVEAGQMELRLQTVAVDESVDQVVKTVEPLVAKKSIQLVVTPAPGLDVLADPGKLKQMLLNLVSNAIKFTADGGRVAITAQRAADRIEISVTDSGIGIAEQDQAEIFQEFHQLDQGPDRKHEGTGLGLALTKRFALLHGGDVKVASRPGSGSTFTISLPVKGPVSTPVEAPAPHGRPAAGALVMVVEDDPAAAELLVRHLGAAGYRTEVVRSGTEAIAKARRLQPAAITLDIILPELDGWEVITRLKRDPATSAIPIVVVSVVDNPELGMALGAIDYIVKPLDGKDLIDRLNRFGIKNGHGNGQLSVLVVDDESANLQLLTRTLEPAGFRVVTASGGREAISLVRSQKPDLVLLDLMMPEVSGFDVVEALRADAATRDTPVMVLTAAVLTEADKLKLNGHVSQVLSRGSTGSSDIIGALRRVIEQHNGSGHT